MALLFYLLLVWLSGSVTFSWGWFFVALIFSLRDAKVVYRYKYTNNPDLGDEEIIQKYKNSVNSNKKKSKLSKQKQ